MPLCKMRRGSNQRGTGHSPLPGRSRQRLARPVIGRFACVGLALCGAGIGPNQVAAAGFDLDFFKPTTPSTGTFCEENGLTVAPGRLDLGASGGYAYRPLVLGNQANSAVVGDVVRERVTTFLAASYGITDNIDFGFRLAAVARQVGTVDADIATNAGVPQHPRSAALGDLDLIARVGLLRVNRAHKRFRLTLLAPLAIPTGATDALASNGRVSFRPRLIAGWHWDRTAAAVSAGYGYTAATEVSSSALVVGKAVVAGLAFSYAVVPGRVWIQAEASFNMGIDLSATGRGTAATQVMTGPRVLIPGGIVLQAGVGTGLMRSAGSPRLSGVFSVARVWDFR
ncbi:MAG: hypothetical protein H7X95_04670 [Deltaproteobacteria bacterium]|nr:hypothetical protein [Deltaproteobacteria bacterium]